MKIVDIARVCHESYRAHCEAIGEPPVPGWDDLPQEERDEVMEGVMYVNEHPLSSPKDMHDNWMAKRVSDEWIYGPKKSRVFKTNPCLLPFDDLPPEQRAKDYVFEAIVKSMTPKENTWGHAFDALVDGQKVYRAAWKSFGMFVFLVPGSGFKVTRPPLLGIFPEGQEVQYNPHIDMHGPDGSIGTWTPTNQDLMAKDWQWDRLTT